MFGSVKIMPQQFFFLLKPFVELIRRLIRMLPIFQILTKKNCNSASFWITGYHFVVSNFLSPLSLVNKSFFYCNRIMVSFKIFKGEGNADIFVRKNDRLVSAKRRKESPTFWYFFSFFKSIYWEMSYRIFPSLSEFEGWANFRQQKTYCFGIINWLFSDNRKALSRKSSILYPFERCLFLVVLSIQAVIPVFRYLS